MQKKIALLHRYTSDQIKETNAAFPYLLEQPMPLDFRAGAVNYKYYPVDVLTFKKFNRVKSFKKFWKGLAWIVYAPMLVFGKGYDVIYCDDSYPFYPALVKMVSPRSKVVIRIGDFHLMYYYRGFIYKFLHFLEKISWIMADKIIVISEVMADEVEKEIGKRSFVVNDPVDPKDFTNATENYGDVMFHGVLTRNKNVDILIEAAKLLPEIDFTIIGDGPDFKRLAHMAPSNVYFRGWIPFKEIHVNISTCAVGVALRSDNPGNEYVVTSPFLQYGVMGKPCLVTRRKVFGDYPGQFSNVDELVSKIKYLVADPIRNKMLGRQLKEYIIKNHEAKKIAEEIWSLLQS